ncbi:MAG TPA: hypothetical protein VII41_01765 [Steroidobacteraceae bacterium]
MTGADEALAFIRAHGIVLVSAKGLAPRLTEFIAGEPIKGSWWAHAKGKQIFAVLQLIGASNEILTCRLINGKLTLIHRRLWPALVRAADLFSAYQLAQVHQQHTASGHHMSSEVAYPDWVPRDVLDAAQRLSVEQARSVIGRWAAASTPDKARVNRRSAKRRRPSV